MQVRTASQYRDTKSKMLSQVNVASVKGTISNQAYKDMPRKPNRRHNDVSLTQKREKPRLDTPGTLLHPTTRMPKPEFFMKIEEKVHAKEEEMHQLQARTQEKKEAEIKQLRRNLNFKETPMPAFYHEPSCRSVKNKADSWQSGSISFSRFENDALCWERRSSFTHNRYLEEVEKYFKPGSVTEKKTYFEELFRRRALLSQSSSDCQDGADSQASNDGSENTDYEGDFEHVNEIGHSACFVENHDRAATLLENGKYQASENEGYAGNFEPVNEVGHSACFDENYDSSTHLSKNGKYQAENTGYDGDFERVNEVGDSARFEESFDRSNNGDIEVTEFGGEGSSNRDIEVIECGGEDSISCHSGPQTEQDTNSFDVLQSVPECLEAAKFNLSAGNSAFNDLEITCFIQVSSGSKANVLNQHKSSEEQPIARKVVASRASCTEKVSHRLYQSVNRKRNADCSFDLCCAMCRKIKKQRSNSYGEISISK
ncbi:hypothetical protein T459_35037 [Capsicum annuum]|uniref:TPX2 C-terminal domain-containing protein n=1 Tax=Capsicum annuum TaxID=4072 RepID=A0A2G2XUB5_CAPAN|nr:hypothetical protein T459_35037 [Capsicum annuum]